MAMVGGSVDSVMTTGLVGWMMRVGSINGGSTVGGRKGVGVGAEVHADSRKRIKVTTKKNRLVWMRFIIKKKGDPSPSRPTGILLFYSGRAAVIPSTDVQW